MMTNYVKTTIILLLLLTGFTNSYAQQDTTRHDQLIQFSGVVVNKDSLKPIPYTSIMIKNTNRGTVSDYFGYFSFVAQPGDTIVFTALGYKKANFTIPDSLTTDKYSLIQILKSDTFFLKTAVIYPWPSKDQFKEAFLKLKIPEDDLQRAKKNIARAEEKAAIEGMSMDGSMNYTNQMQQEYSKLYYAGQYPPNNLLNPIAWAKFIQAWKNGDFKRKNTSEGQ